MTRARELADLLTGGQTISTADNSAQLTLESTDADASVGPLLDMIRDSASPADSDTLGRLRFRGDNDAGEAFTYGTITSKITDASDGTEGGLLTFLVGRNGSVTSALDLNETETVFNEGGLNADFRVESDTNTHMLFVDADSELVTIGTSIGSLFNAEGTVAALTVAGSDTSTTTTGNGGAAINISNTDGTGGNTAGIHFSREDNDGNPHFSGAAIVAQFPDDQTTGEYPKGRLHFNTSTTANAAPSTKMTLLEDGKLGIGTSSPDKQLHIEGSSSTAYSSSDFDQPYNLIKIENTNTSSSMAAGIQFLVGSNGEAAISTTRTGDGAAALCFGTRGGGSRTERMRIDSSGNIMMNTTSIGGTSILSLGSSNYMVATHNDGGTSGFFGQIRFRNNANNADVGTINRVNDASVQYNTTSDARLKENVADMTGAIARVKQLSPKRYSWVNEELDAADQDGFLAHEAQAVVPIAVSGTKDEVEVWQEGEDLPDDVSVGDNKLDSDGNTIPVFMQMDYSKLVPLLTGALKEAIAKIETLETKVAALEAE